MLVVHVHVGINTRILRPPLGHGRQGFLLFLFFFLLLLWSREIHPRSQNQLVKEKRHHVHRERANERDAKAAGERLEATIGQHVSRGRYDLQSWLLCRLRLDVCGGVGVWVCEVVGGCECAYICVGVWVDVWKGVWVYVGV
jgi:hypothetical protein